MQVIFENEYSDTIIKTSLTALPAIGNSVEIYDEQYYVHAVVWHIYEDKAFIVVTVSETPAIDKESKISMISNAHESVNAERLAKSALKETRTLKGAVAELQNRPQPKPGPRQ